MINDEHMEEFINFFRENTDEIQEKFQEIYDSKVEEIENNELWCHQFSLDHPEPTKDDIKEIFAIWLDANIEDSIKLNKELKIIYELANEKNWWSTISHMAEVGYLKFDSKSCILNNLLNQGITTILGNMMGEERKKIPKNVDEFLEKLFEKKDPE